MVEFSKREIIKLCKGFEDVNEKFSSLTFVSNKRGILYKTTLVALLRMHNLEKCSMNRR